MLMQAEGKYQSLALSLHLHSTLPAAHWHCCADTIVGQSRLREYAMIEQEGLGWIQEHRDVGG